MSTLSANTRRLIVALVFFVWVSIIMVAFYVVQKPALFAILPGWLNSIWSILLTLVLLTNACCLGLEFSRFLKRTELTPWERLIISTGLGLGFLGILGLIIASLRIPFPFTFGILQAGLMILFGWRRTLQSLWGYLCDITIEWKYSASQTPWYIRGAVVAAFSLIFVLSLAPPIEGFDALLYHLVWPARILEDSGIQPYNVSPFWHPALVEGVFLWAQGLGSDRAPQLLHFSWTCLSILLVWYWAYSVFGIKTGQRVLVLFLCIPSLYLLASWAYTDFALSFYGVMALYGIYKTNSVKTKSSDTGWTVIAAVAAGMAISIKYTGFLVPVSCVFVILYWKRKSWKLAIKSSIIFSLVTLLVASPWYLRNWIVMENPFYPFLWNGLFWDDFRAKLYADPGTGIGWNIKELLLLPINATLGHRDVTFHDARIGLMYIVFTPPALYVFLTSRRLSPIQRNTLFPISLFVSLSLMAWTLGVINSRALWQTRLLFPMLIPYTLPVALGWLTLKKLDSSSLKISFIINAIVSIVVIVTLIEAGVFLINRNPLAFALGIESRERYMSKVQPSYTQAVKLVEETPQDASVYFLFEPRSYYMQRNVQPDALLDNLVHDIYVYETPVQVVNSWKDQGYTHVLIYQRGVDFLENSEGGKLSPETQKTLDSIIKDHLIWIDTTNDGAYELYRINPP